MLQLRLLICPPFSIDDRSYSAPSRTRTSNLRHVRAALQPLSYRRNISRHLRQWANVGSNHGPPASQAGALAAELQAQNRAKNARERAERNLAQLFPGSQVIRGLLSTGKNSRPIKAGSAIYRALTRRCSYQRRGITLASGGIAFRVDTNSAASVSPST